MFWISLYLVIGALFFWIGRESARYEIEARFPVLRYPDAVRTLFWAWTFILVTCLWLPLLVSGMSRRS